MKINQLDTLCSCVFLRFCPQLLLPVMINLRQQFSELKVSAIVKPLHLQRDMCSERRKKREEKPSGNQCYDSRHSENVCASFCHTWYYKQN